MKHGSSLSNDAESLRGLHGLCRERLKELGISSSRQNQKSKTRHFASTPGKKAMNPNIKTPSKSAKQSVFGRPLRDLPPSSVIISQEIQLQVPHFLVAILNYLRENLNTEGLFRKAGSAGRQRVLRAEIEEAETFFIDKSKEESKEDNFLSALDVASLLKQWLRELPEPLIPQRFHETFLKCCKLSGDSKIEAILTASLLLPPLHSASLTCLMRFLSDVAEASAENKMDSRSLAIVFTPSLFPVTEEATNIKKVEVTNADLANKLEIVQALIENSNAVCMIDHKIEEALNIPVLQISEDNLSDDEDYESYAGGPSARRMKSHQKKKRRSGSLSRYITATMKGLHKAIRSTTPAGVRTQPSAGAGSAKPERERTHQNSAQTPIFQSPRLPVKRKVSVDEPDLSPNSKHRRAALESTVTPKVMGGRSVSIKNRFKREKSLTDGGVGPAKFKEPSLIIRHTFDGNTQASAKTPSLPNKAKLSSLTHTPGHYRDLTNFFDLGTPAGLPFANQDLSSEALENDDDKSAPSSPFQSISARSSKSSLTSVDSTISSKSYPGRVVKRKNSDRRYAGKPRSPGERKIGIVRRRSQEMAHKKSLIRDDKNKLKHLPMMNLDESLVKNQLRRGRPNTFRIKPSPMKVETATPDGKKTARIKISFRDGQLQSPKVQIKNPPVLRDTSAICEQNTETSSNNRSATSKNGSLRKEVNESLSNLRQDISSMIEQSFGSVQDPENPGMIVDKPISDAATADVVDTFSAPADKFTLEELTLPRLPSSIQRSSMRRQSSAFEIPSKDFPSNGLGSSHVRRQSSAFELAALIKLRENNFNRGVATRASLKQRNSSVKDLVSKLEVSKPASASEEKQQPEVPRNKRMSISTSVLPPPSMPEQDFQNFFKMPSPPKETPVRAPAVQERGRQRSRIPIMYKSPPTEIEVEEAKDDFPTNENEWMDANDFFNSDDTGAGTGTAAKAGTRTAHLAFEETPGCKRSSIIRIRTEKKGLVSRSVDTFSKPALPPPMMTPRRAPRPPACTPASATTRRNSARMGVAGSRQPLHTCAAGGTPSSGVATRRQTLTGIRTGIRTSTALSPATPAEASKRVVPPPKRPTAEKPVVPLTDEPIYGNIESVKVTKGKPLPRTPVLNGEKSQDSLRITRRSNTPRSQNRTPRTAQLRKSKRIEGRRFLTIGYDGEMRSPLRDRKNTPTNATVQRSKSAQTPSKKTQLHLNKKDKNEKENLENENALCRNVQRSLSLRSPRPLVVVPASLKETIYDITTPKSEKVKRQLSDRVMTPRGGRPEAVPFIKAVLTKSRNNSSGHQGSSNNGGGLKTRLQPAPTSNRC